MAFRHVLRAFRVLEELGGTLPNYNPNTNASASCDQTGALFVRDISGFFPGSSRFEYNTAGYANSGVVAPGTNAYLTQIGGFNNGAIAYLLLFAANPVPAAGTVPFQSFLVPAGGSFSWAPTTPGYRTSTGLSFGVSSTGNLYTPIVGTDFWVYAEGIAL